MTNSQIRPTFALLSSPTTTAARTTSKDKCLQNNSSARTHVHHAFYISLTSLHDYHVKLPHETCLRVEKFPFSFWTWKYGPSEFYSGKNHPRLTNWAGLNAMKFKKRELFFLPTFSLPSSLKLLELPRGGKLTNPLLKLFLLSHLFPH